MFGANALTRSAACLCNLLAIVAIAIGLGGSVALGLVMILSDSVDAVKSINAWRALPFVFVVLLLVACLLKALKAERRQPSWVICSIPS